jgi:hypothetical protein
MPVVRDRRITMSIFSAGALLAAFTTHEKLRKSLCGNSWHGASGRVAQPDVTSVA